MGTFGLAITAQCLWPWQLTEMAWLRGLGGAIFAAGAALAALTAVQMVRAGGNPLPRNPSKVLVKKGLFRYTRNPLYVLNLVNYLGLVPVLNSVWPLLFFAPMLAILYWGIILREERFLAAKFGREYLDYQQGVPRWLSFRNLFGRAGTSRSSKSQNEVAARQFQN